MLAEYVDWSDRGISKYMGACQDDRSPSRHANVQFYKDECTNEWVMILTRDSKSKRDFMVVLPDGLVDAIVEDRMQE